MNSRPTWILNGVVMLAIIFSLLPAQTVQSIAQPLNPAASISGRVTDGAGNGVPGVAISAVPNDCAGATATQPVLLVTGWGGSVGKTKAIEDENLRYTAAALEQHGYVEGCNLFYASGTSPMLLQFMNAIVIRDEICKDYAIVKEKFPGWRDIIFNIIGHSYGGLRARAYLESDLFGKT